MIKFRIFEKIAKKCSFQLGKKPSFENRFGEKFGKTPVLKNEKKNTVHWYSMSLANGQTKNFSQ